MRKDRIKCLLTEALFNLMLENPDKVFPGCDDQFKDDFICGIAEDDLEGEITFPVDANNDDGSPVKARISIALLK